VAECKWVTDGHSEVIMKSAIAKCLGATMLAVSIGWLTGCDIPEEKKSVFQKAHTIETDSAHPGLPKSDSKNSQDEKKKPHAFSIRDKVDV
jgi:hypothetical protein